MGAREDGRDLAMIDLWRDLPKSLRNAGAGERVQGCHPLGAVQFSVTSDEDNCM